MRLHVDLEGGTGPHLLLIHGFMASRAQWLANLARLRTVCRPVVVELWGHGRSPTPTDPDSYRVDGYVRQFEQIRGELGVPEWFVCGQSFGAGLAIRYALACPGAVQGLIITNSVSALAPPAPDGDREAAASAILAGGHDGLRTMPYYPRAGGRLPAGVAAGLIADAELLSPTAIAQAIRFTGPDLAAGAALSELSIPTLLVNGAWERAFQPLRQGLPDRLPSAEIVDLAAGHAINAEAPEAFDAAVADFLTRHGRGED